MLILWDGECNMCRRCAAWCKEKGLDVCAYQQAPSPPMTPELYEACADAVHVVLPNGTVLKAGRAVLAILAALGWPVGLLALPPFIWIVELAYTIVANNRSIFTHILFTRERYEKGDPLGPPLDESLSKY
jgi:predicted DCC family thiol-disulfide oxidoreductase YuxK